MAKVCCVYFMYILQSHLLDKLKSTQTFHAVRFSGRSRREGEKIEQKGDDKKRKKEKGRMEERRGRVVTDGLRFG